ncbi:hypothetical protein B9L21_05150 [Geobacillus uzenensis]|uniref:Uncharacterized protein n=1 Tax=Geobacillus uzenensis TaxID=129339 RepID=A0ABX4DJ75_9BACL|nr:hypothetical protein B9L21_05150 [Geobacillus uzenensis]
MPPQQGRSVASRWRPELDSTKSGSAAIGSRSQMFFTRRGACTPRGKVIWQKRANVLHPQGCLHPEGEGYLAEESQALELDNTKREGRERPTINKSRFRFVQF